MTLSNQSLARLGVNIDHLATLRQLRGTPYPDLVEATKLVKVAGGQQITIHLREDRRHIQDQDVIDLIKKCPLPINLEMGLNPKIIQFAIKVKPEWVCLVPEKRDEVTTEGGLDLKRSKLKLKRAIPLFKKRKIKVSLFIEPDLKMIQMAADLQANAIEIHTGRYCLAAQGGFGKKSDGIRRTEYEKIVNSALLGRKLGLKVHAGHGFDSENIRPIAHAMDAEGKPLIEEFNVGHAIVCRASLVGLVQAVREMGAAIWAP